MPEIARATPAAISDLTGTWALDPRRTTIQFQTKAMWVLNVNGTLRATEGSGAVDGNGQVTGRLVVDANSIGTKNKRRGRTPVTTRSGDQAATPAQYRSPLGRRPYDLRHAAVSLWLNSGVPATEVARRAGHGVAVLLKIYAHCIDGQATAANQRIAEALGIRGPHGPRNPAPTDA